MHTVRDTRTSLRRRFNSEGACINGRARELERVALFLPSVTSYAPGEMHTLRAACGLALQLHSRH